MFRILLLAMAWLALNTPVSAGETENIQACMAALKANTGKVVDEFDVQYESHFLTFDVARWPEVECEVVVGEVHNLTVAGRKLIVEGWPSPEAKAAYEALELEVSAATDQLNTRQQLIESRLSEAYEKLRQPGADVDAASDYVRQGIQKALGK